MNKTKLFGKKYQGFSLAEAMITLMIVSLILAAVVPVMTKKTASMEQPWRYTENFADIYYGRPESSQAAIIGAGAAPTSSIGARLVIATPADSSSASEDQNKSAIRRPLLAFYQLQGSDPKRIGKLSFDQAGNIALGLDTLSKNVVNGVDGVNNISVGKGALSENVTGSNTIAIGLESLMKNTSGNGNVAYGYQSLRENSDGDFNTAVGLQSLIANQSGSRNIAIGNNTLRGITSGSNNIAIGDFAGPENDVSNGLFIDNVQTDTPLIGGDFTAGAKQVTINGAFSVTGNAVITGNLTAAGTMLASDERLKNVGKDNSIGLDKVLAINIKDYTYKSDKTQAKHVGVIAQQLQKVLPDAVIKGTDGYYSVDTNYILFTIVNAVKQLNTKIIAVTEKVNSIETKINTVLKENADLKKENANLKKEIAAINQRLSKLEAK